MHAAEVVVHEPERDSRSMVFDLFRKGIREPGESADAHSHRKILPFDVTGTDMLGIRIPADDFHVTADTFRRRVASLILAGCCIGKPKFQLRVRREDVSAKVPDACSGVRRGDWYGSNGVLDL
jgi:hypothetical protein